MWPRFHCQHPLHEGVSRRDLIRVGALSVLGLALPDLLRARANPVQPRSGSAKSCIFLYLSGGPAQHETWDPKPDTPAEIRGEFKAVATNVPGIFLGEHLPRLAQIADKFSLIRSCTHEDIRHSPSSYTLVTGRSFAGPINGSDAAPSRRDFPPYGAVISRLRPPTRPVPGWVMVGEQPVTTPASVVYPGQHAGFLGSIHDPLWIRNDPNAADFQVEGLTLSDADIAHLDARWALRQRVDNGMRRLEHDDQVQGMNAYQQRAMHLLTSSETRRALQIGQEAASVRDRYGRNIWGQSMLLARRLVEAGVPLINVYLRDITSNVKAPFGQWDTHTDQFPTLKDKLLPPFDQALSALLTDLDARGLLAETIVVAAGEFGRTPRIGQVLTGVDGCRRAQRTRPLALGLFDVVCRRRIWRRACAWEFGPNWRPSRQPARVARRFRRHALSFSWHRSRQRDPRSTKATVPSMRRTPHYELRPAVALLRRTIARAFTPNLRVPHGTNDASYCLDPMPRWSCPRRQLGSLPWPQRLRDCR